MKEENLLAWRHEFPILEHTTYLISNSLGAMPRGVNDALRAYADSWATQGVRAWEADDWMGLAMRVGDEVAEVIGAPVGSVSAHVNVTLASAVVASCFDFEAGRAGSVAFPGTARGNASATTESENRPVSTRQAASPARNKIVCSTLNFPSILYLYRQQERYGAKLQLIESPDGITVPLDEMLEAIDETTLLVPISHVIFKSAFVQDVVAIVERAHEVGAYVVLDIYQSAGVMPVELSEWDVDFAVGGTLKWLCGGPGCSYLYVNPEIAERFEPAITGWFSHVSPFSFDPGPLKRRTDGWRFLNGTPSIPALYAVRPGLEIIRQIPIEAIRAKSIRQTQLLIDAADEHGWEVNTPRDPEQRGGTVSLNPPDAERITGELLDRDILVDYRPGAGIRLSPHFYTTDEEIDHAVATIAELVGAGVKS